MDETARRRNIQNSYNEEHHIIPKTIVKEVRDEISLKVSQKEVKYSIKDTLDIIKTEELIRTLTEDMLIAAEKLEFEKAAGIRDQIYSLKNKIKKAKK